MARIGYGKQTPTRYEALAQQRERRRAIVEHGMNRSENMRNFMVANINSSASTTVQTTEMLIRSKAQAAAKATAAAKLNKLA
jgi:hypothetical protein